MNPSLKKDFFDCEFRSSVDGVIQKFAGEKGTWKTVKDSFTL